MLLHPLHGTTWAEALDFTKPKHHLHRSPSQAPIPQTTYQNGTISGGKPSHKFPLHAPSARAEVRHMGTHIARQIHHAEASRTCVLSGPSVNHAGLP